MTNADTSSQTHDKKEGFDLDPIEIRVLAVMIEKAFVTPDAYPMSVNSIQTGCNQLTGRDPVMTLSDVDVRDGLDRLLARKLVSKRDQASARVPKFEHLIRLRHSLPPAEQAVLAVLLLRGPQTPGEIRQRTERMHAFTDIEAVDAILTHLQEKYPPMVAPLPRAPGTKETRYAHLLGGQTMFDAQAENIANHGVTLPSSRSRTTELEDEVRRLQDEVAKLRADFDTFRAQFD